MGHYFTKIGVVLGKNFTVKKRALFSARSYQSHRVTNYMLEMMASPNSEHFSNLAPSIRRSKS